VKKIKFILTIFIIFIGFEIYSQQNKGKVSTRVYWNFNKDFTKDAPRKNAFEIKRAYFGYEYRINDNISSKVTFDVGKNSSGSDYTAFLKIAQLDWKIKNNLKLSIGMIGNKQFKFQESIWGYRYMYKTFQDENKFGSSADLGVNAEIKLSDKINLNLFALNGEGYKNVQDDNGFIKIGGNLIYEFDNGFSAKIYYDSQPSIENFNLVNTGYFIGYEKEKTRIGLEYNEMLNGKTYKDPSKDHSLSGFSGYISQTLSKNATIFFRYDSLGSNILSGSLDAWNSGKDGNLMILGFEHVVTKGFKLNLNYRNYNYNDTSINNKSMVFINAEIKI
jgi:hypothetical protein